MKIKKWVKYPISSCYMILGYIIGFISIFNGLSIYDYCEKYEKDSNNYKYKNNIEMCVSMSNEKIPVDIEVLLNLDKYNYYIKDEVLLYFNKNKENRMVDVLLNTNEETNYCLLEGRLPNKKEVEQRKNVIAIGKEIQEQTYIKNNKKYIDIYSVPYEVVGIIGTELSDLQDYKVVTYYRCLDNRSKMKLNLNEIYLSISSNNENIDIANIEQVCKKDSNLELKVINNEELDMAVLSDDKIKANFYILVYVFSIVNCMIICEFWLYQRRREVVIRKAYGYSNVQIIKLIFGEMFKIILTSSVCGYFIQTYFLFFMEQQGLKFECSLIYVIKFVALVFITTVISIFIPIYRIVKKTPIQELTRKGVI